MSVVFDEVVTEIEPAASPRRSGSSTQRQSASEQLTPNDHELAQRIARMQERHQRLVAD